MASVSVEALSKQEKDELVCAYAALLLHDDGQEISVRTPPFLKSLIIDIGRETVQSHQSIRQ